jgi:hypothetical protein
MTWGEGPSWPMEEKGKEKENAKTPKESSGRGKISKQKETKTLPMSDQKFNGYF